MGFPQCHRKIVAFFLKETDTANMGNDWYFNEERITRHSRRIVITVTEQICGDQLQKKGKDYLEEWL